MNQLRISPLTRITSALIIGLLTAVMLLVFATQQPWLNIDWSWDSAANGAVLKRDREGSAGLGKGTVIVALGNDQHSLTLRRDDFTEEPDGNLPSYQAYEEFLQRQQAMHELLHSPQLWLEDDQQQRHYLTTEPQRPLSDLPASFWIQIVVGVVAWLISTAVWAFRPRQASAAYLLLSGAGTLMSAGMASVYSTRELAINGTLFRWLCDLNYFGGIIFAATLCCVLWHYPRRLGWRGTPGIILGLTLIWFALQQLHTFDSMMVGRRLPVLIALLSSFALSYAQWRNTRHDPVGRAALQWFLMSWLLTSTAFSALIFVPQLLGIQTGSLQGYSFLLFLVLYMGLAFGILRFRLFGLGKWWLRIFASLAALVLLSGFDLLFAVLLQLSPEQALGLAVIAAAFVWLPFRAWLWDRLGRQERPRPRDLFGDIVEIAFASSTARRNAAWQALLKRSFDPLRCEAVTSAPHLALADNGLLMLIPGNGDISATLLGYAKAGKRLFNQEDIHLVQEMLRMVEHVTLSRDAYQRGVDNERSRIAQDLHDNIGSTLLAGLHRKDIDGTRSSIRAAIAEMRTIVNGLTGRNTEVAVMLGDLRYECESRLNDVGITLNWVHDAAENPSLSYAVYQNYVSIIREAVSNVINHANAKRLTIAVECQNHLLTTHIEDDGMGFIGRKSGGHGMLNLQRRVNQLGGSIHIHSASTGTTLQIDIPVDTPDPEDATLTLFHPQAGQSGKAQSRGGENGDQVSNATPG